MPVTSQPTDQPYGQQLITDEQTLERFFREGYARWIEEAKRRLGDAAPAAPRVVSKAFHLAWQDRKRFHTKEELDAFLGANIQHGSARELSRRAGLHRMDAHEGGHKEKEHHDIHEMTVDEAWQRLQVTLKGGAPEAQRARASNARHEAAEHVAQLARPRNWTPMLVAGVGALVVLLGIAWYLDRSGESRVISNALAASDARAHETGAGQQLNVTLDDGTVVRLAPQSKLTIPKRFGSGLRAVRVDGAAHFQVTDGMRQPFELRSGDVAVIVRGTAFTVRRYPEDAHVVVHVSEGKVEVSRGKETRSVGAGLSYVLANDGSIRPASAEEATEASSWAEGRVTLANHTLREVLPLLKRWYGLDVRVPDAQLLDRKVFVTAAVNSPREAISAVEESGGVKFGYIGENMVFQDTVPSRPVRRTR